MNNRSEFVKNNGNSGGSIAPIKNVSLCLGLAQVLQSRPLGLDKNICVFAGYSGLGKSIAALFTQNMTNAAYVEMSDTWTKKRLLTAILSEFGVLYPRGTLCDLEEQVIAVMARNPLRPLIIDEADKLVDRNMIELVRMIAKKSNGPILLIGEELLPEKLNPIDRVRDLVIETGYAQPCDLEDVKKLAEYLYPKMTIDEKLLDMARVEAGGRARRIGNSLHMIVAAAKRAGKTAITLEDYRAGNGLFARDRLPRREEAIVAPMKQRAA